MSSIVHELCELAKITGVIFENSGQVEPFLAFFERISNEGGVVVLKWDGKRGDGDGGRYTAIISGGGLGEDFVRADGVCLKEVAASVVVQYGRRIWLSNAGS